MRKISLCGDWRGKCIFSDGSFDFVATVPGSSINDLIAAGKLPEDIFFADNAERVRDFERCDYLYEREFELTVEDGKIYTLEFCKLDTYATVKLNGAEIAKTQNAFIEHRLDVTDKLVNGKNTLSVSFRSPITEVEGREDLPAAFTRERLHTRRIQCTYGWDWVARFVSCGITGDVSLISEDCDEMAIDGAYIYTEGFDKDSASVVIDLSFREKRASGAVSLAVLSPSGRTVNHAERYCNEPLVKFRLDIPRAELWYPHGYGAQPLYTLVVSTGGRELYRERFGIRTVKIMQLPDKKGSSYDKKADEVHNLKYDFNEEHSGFILKVNGRRIFCQGANYVPCEPFMHGDTAKKQTELLLLARDMGVNMIRMWGGGDFETRHFYDECSRLGIMVTQDFLMACGSYPEGEDWFIEELSKEAHCAALRLRNQPCLVWWSGDNENAVHGNDLEPDYKGRRSAFFGIAPVLYKLDPHRPFLPSSPFGGKKYASNTVGTTHNTQFIGDLLFPYMLGGKCDDYREHFKKFRARFIAEEPQLGAVSYGTIRRFMTDEQIYGDDRYMWNYHTKSNPAIKTSLYDMSAKFAESMLGGFTSGEDRFFKLRYLQYEWIRLSMEQVRRETWFSSGIVFWMLNDCWPASSGWSIIDYYNKPKDAYYAFARASKRIILSIDRTPRGFSVHASNIGDPVKNASLTVYAVSGKGVRRLLDAEYSLARDSSRVVARLGEVLSDGEVLIAETVTGDLRDRTYYREGAPRLTPASCEMLHDAEAKTVTVRASEYIHAVELDADAVFSDNCFSLLPGESVTVSYRPLGEVDKIDVTAYTFK